MPSNKRDETESDRYAAAWRRDDVRSTPEPDGGSRFAVTKRTIGLTLALVAVGLLLEGTMTRDWWVLDHDQRHIRIDMGMTSSRVCKRDEGCKVVPHAKLASLLAIDDRVWLMAGAAAAWGAYVNAAFLLAIAFLGWRGRRQPGVLLSQITAVLSGLILLWGALYVLLFPSTAEATVRWGHSSLTYFAGAVCALAGAVLLAVSIEEATTPTLVEVFD